MKKVITFLLLLICSYSYGQVTISPYPFDTDASVTITIDENSSATDCNKLNNPNKVYIHFGIGPADNPWTKVIGNWGQDDGIGEMTDNGDGTWSITLVPETYFDLSDSEIETFNKVGMVFRNESGGQEYKDNGCNDFFFDVGTFQMTLISPEKEYTDLLSGETLNIVASSTESADFTLKANGLVIDSQSNTDNYSFSQANLAEDTVFLLEASNNSKTVSKEFKVFTTVNHSAVPTGMKDGINLHDNDATKATLVLYAPGKEIVELIGDFNNWIPTSELLMNKDDSNDRFWIELSNLTPQHNHMYQYLVDGAFRIADPYSTTILDPYNDHEIDALTYPNLPDYPSDKTSHSVTLLKTGEDTFNWQHNNFDRPQKEELVVYELLIRDFDALHSFDAVKDRLDYLENLGINAIELMPVNEFDGNNSWGYNPAYHMALDKYYGNSTAFKQLIDECHSRGIAVIVDVVYNHASGQHPYFRMWNSTPNGYNGIASAENPFFNATAKHSYNVDNDINHSTEATNDYIKRITQYWIEEYNIDGFRWDLTKGFTQNCTSGDDGCTGSKQEDRIAVLKKYADYQWEVDSDFYVIFEHLGTNEEETEWANYRLNEGKGIMLWGNSNYNYNQNTKGASNDTDISWISYKQRGWTAPSVMGYMESHDEERLMFNNLNSGNSNGDYNVRTLETALSRMELAGMFLFSIPGPKMIWQFGELGYDFSINSDLSGEIDEKHRTSPKPIRWDYLENDHRKHIYNTWASLLAMKKKYSDVFNTSDFTLNVGGLTKSVLLKHSSMDLVFVGNFDLSNKTISTTFSKTGTWYEYFSGEEREVTSTSSNTILKPGEYRLYSTQRIVDPRGGTSNDDSDGDGVVDSIDRCPNTFPGTDVNETGCPAFSLPTDNFTIEVTSESCAGSDDGKIVISSVVSDYNLSTVIGGTTYNFNVGKTISKLKAGTYDFCIVVGGQSYEQCFSVTIEPGTVVSAKSTIKSKKMNVEMESGTAPYSVNINGILVLETYSKSFSVPIAHGDLVEVFTNKSCEGIIEEKIVMFDSINAFPNPTNGLFEIAVPFEFDNVLIDLYTPTYQLISSRNYSIQNGKVQLNIENLNSGLYIAKVNAEKPVIIKIIKN